DYLALVEVPNSLILPITVALIASRAGPKYLRGSYISLSLSKASRTALAEAIWFSVLTLIFAVPTGIAFGISFVGILVPPRNTNPKPVQAPNSSLSLNPNFRAPLY